MKSVIVAPSLRSNSLGRALALADLYETLGATEVCAFGDGPIWSGARTFARPVRIIKNYDDLKRRLQTISSDLDLVVAVKPYRTSLGWVGALMSDEAPGGALVVDVDDHDEDIQRQAFAQLQPARRLVAVAKRSEAPWRIRRRLASGLRRADLVTVSSHALGGALPSHSAPMIRVPHPRSARRYEPPTLSSTLRFGFLGTPRRYKGLDEIADVLRYLPTSELHVLAGTVETFVAAGIDRRRIVEHAHAGPETITNALRFVDIALLPQDVGADAARFQLPAKYLDAIAGGRPVLASRTPVLEEFRIPGVALLDRWTEATVLAALAPLNSFDTRAEMGANMVADFAGKFSTGSIVEDLESGVIEALAAARR